MNAQFVCLSVEECLTECQRNAVGFEFVWLFIIGMFFSYLPAFATMVSEEYREKAEKYFNAAQYAGMFLQLAGVIMFLLKMRGIV